MTCFFLNFKLFIVNLYVTGLIQDSGNVTLHLFPCSWAAFWSNPFPPQGLAGSPAPRDPHRTKQVRQLWAQDCLSGLNLVHASAQPAMLGPCLWELMCGWDDIQ